jgi:hypothetical protein
MKLSIAAVLLLMSVPVSALECIDVLLKAKVAQATSIDGWGRFCDRSG